VKSHQHQYIYQAFGLTIDSSLEIPELLPSEGVPDVLIREGSVPETLENPKAFGVRFQASPGYFLLKVDNIAKYLVSEGCRVTIEAFPGVEARDIRLFLLNSVLGALVHQRGLLPLHASAIEVCGQCVVFCGASGCGKSTLAKAFIKRGYCLHTDDVCMVSTGEDGIPIAYPGCPQLKLWEDALEKIGINPGSYSRVRRVLDKFAIPVTEHFNHQPLPIQRIYILSPWNKGEIEVTEIAGMKKFSVLKSQTYRFRFIKGLGREVLHFKSSGILGNHVPICSVRCPQSLFLLDELADILEKEFIK
jgi:hypothetical protein